MNNKGQTLMLALAMAFIIFIAGMLFINFLKPEVTNTRAAITGLDCTNSSISDGTKLTCLGADVTVPYFMVAIISLAGGLVLAKFLI